MRKFLAMLLAAGLLLMAFALTSCEKDSAAESNVPEGVMILDEERMADFEGLWHEEDFGCTLEIADGHLWLYPDDDPQTLWIDADIHVIGYENGDPDAMYLAPADLTQRDFGLYTTFKADDGSLNTMMIVYDAQETVYLHFEPLEEAMDDPGVFDPSMGDPLVCYKPVIYLYPSAEMQVDVRFGPDVALSCSYPAYEDGWQVTARPDGTLTDAQGVEYNYLYWEGVCEAEWDFSKGFCVPGRDTAAFLENALAEMGLSRREANEFIVYWLPLMQDSAYNLIAFQGENYTRKAQLLITPEPDGVNRVFMAWKPLDAPVEIEPQTLSAPDRGSFSVVEWGGTRVDR